MATQVRFKQFTPPIITKNYSTHTFPFKFTKFTPVILKSLSNLLLNSDFPSILF